MKAMWGIHSKLWHPSGAFILNKQADSGKNSIIKTIENNIKSIFDCFYCELEQVFANQEILNIPLTDTLSMIFLMIFLTNSVLALCSIYSGSTKKWRWQRGMIYSPCQKKVRGWQIMKYSIGSLQTLKLAMKRKRLIGNWCD